MQCRLFTLMVKVLPITVLQDDKHLYPSYMSGNVVRSEILIAHPELRPSRRSLNHYDYRSRWRR